MSRENVYIFEYRSEIYVKTFHETRLQRLLLFICIIVHVEKTTTTTATTEYTKYHLHSILVKHVANNLNPSTNNNNRTLQFLHANNREVNNFKALNVNFLLYVFSVSDVLSPRICSSLVLLPISVWFISSLSRLSNFPSPQSVHSATGISAKLPVQ
jgi:hypothetical protein